MNNDAFNNIWNWHQKMSGFLRFPFEGANQISQNYSQAWQDIFVLSMLGGRLNGSYLEIGANFAVANSNTALLESSFGWDGFSLEIDPSFFRSWLVERPKANFIIADALTINYSEALFRWFGQDKNRIDYLQLDIEPSFNTLQVLKALPLDTCRFSVITFETDAYMGDFRARDESREILRQHGYELVGRDICVMFAPASPDPIPFEDWWVDPRVVDRNKIEALQQLRDFPLLPQYILFKNFP